MMFVFFNISSGFPSQSMTKRQTSHIFNTPPCMNLYFSTFYPGDVNTIAPKTEAEIIPILS